MKHDIKPGDTVTLGSENGLGTGSFLVLQVYPSDQIHQLLVQGRNGIWPARVEGAKVVGRMQTATAK